MYINPKYSMSFFLSIIQVILKLILTTDINDVEAE
jgi:hypothetical protein